MSYSIRPITQADNDAVAAVIRTVMTEFGAVGAGYSIEDPEVDEMFATYSQKGHAFFVIDLAGSVAGCGGIGTLADAPPDVCELKKMYFLPSLRGMGAGRKLAEHCLATAPTLGYRRCYLETLESMTSARALYRKLGFADIEGPLGNTGHCGCDRWMIKQL